MPEREGFAINLADGHITFNDTVFNTAGIDVATEEDLTAIADTPYRTINPNATGTFTATLDEGIYQRLADAITTHTGTMYTNTTTTVTQENLLRAADLVRTNAYEQHRGYRANQVYIDDLVRDLDWSIINQYITPFETPVPPDTELSDKDNKSLDSFLEGFSKKEAV